MTDKELQHLSRVELIEIIYELQKQNEAAAAQVKRLEKALADREIHISNAGSIAEAAMGLNGVFEAAQAAADQYLLSLQAAAAELKAGVDQAEKQRQSILQGAERQAAWIVRDAEQKAKIRLAEADRQIEQKWDRFERRVHELVAAHPEVQALVKRGG